MGEVREHAVGGGAGALDRLRHAKMELRPAQPREPVVERAAHDLVGEATGQPLGRELLDHSASHRLLQRREKLGLGEAGRGANRLQLELRPGHGGELEQVGGPAGQAREPLADHLANAFRGAELGQRPGHPDLPAGDLDYAGLDQRPPELADEEGVAPGEIVDRGRELAELGVGVASGGAADQIGDLGAGKSREAHPHDVLGAAQVGKRLRELLRHVGLGVAEGHEEEQPGAPGRARQVPQEQERGNVGPVPVLEHQQHRPLAAGPGQQVGDRRVEAMALRIGVGLDRLRQLADQGGQVGQQSGQLAATGADRGSQLIDLGYPHQPIEHLDEGPVGRLHHGVAAAVEDQRPVDCGLAGELTCQAALAGTRLAGEQRHPAALARGLWDQAPKLLQLGRAADERGGRSRAERAREVRGLSFHGKKIVNFDHSPGNRAKPRPWNWVSSGHDRGLRAP